jgi:hypothetical protein
MFYLLGCMLFGVSLIAALFVIASNLSRYRRAMLTALQSLSLEGWNPTLAESPTPHSAPSASYLAGALARPRQAAF